MISSKKTAESLIAAVAALAMLTGCAGPVTDRPGSTSDTGESAADKALADTVTFDWYINYSWFNIIRH